MPNHCATTLPLATAKAARSWRTPRSRTIQPHVLRLLNTNVVFGPKTLESPMARMPSMMFHVPARASMDAANTIQPAPLGATSYRPSAAPASVRYPVVVLTVCLLLFSIGRRAVARHHETSRARDGRPRPVGMNPLARLAAPPHARPT